MPRGKRTQQEYQSALDSAVFGRYEAEVFTDVWNELADARPKVRDWDRARLIVREAAERGAIFFGALDEWGRELIALLSEEGRDA